ncbi:uncharacterized protein BDZ99DRAFT_570143 [Mytilinidion resinicola]|uniref:Uncharacterized protein n=1 Tax=Mytilinidion resinicola TaxID=574789 RepID=A0A6A6YQM4_9PEZI|nr:uncharacterized protein BDZ99DRAFT_570143 [Mytilinidion resinicola]KAF2810833.1 hypothetical protein BDZ99DRAFT_570143 [Mytilinidion resinicola]
MPFEHSSKSAAATAPFQGRNSASMSIDGLQLRGRPGSNKFAFLDLPRELRDMVYDFAYLPDRNRPSYGSTILEVNNKNRYHPFKTPALCHVNRQVLSEALHYFLKDLTIYFYGDAELKEFKNWLGGYDMLHCNPSRGVRYLWREGRLAEWNADARAP